MTTIPSIALLNALCSLRKGCLNCGTGFVFSFPLEFGIQLPCQLQSFPSSVIWSIAPTAAASIAAAVLNAESTVGFDARDSSCTSVRPGNPATMSDDELEARLVDLALQTGLALIWKLFICSRIACSSMISGADAKRSNNMFLGMQELVCKTK